MATMPWLRPYTRPATVALLCVVMLSGMSVLAPAAAGTQAVNPFATLRAPGEPGFVAGHRGDKAGAPENTLPAMQLAIAGPAEFVETDLQLTADGVAVLMHDWTLDRTTDGSGPVWSLTWEQVRRLDAGSWFSPEFRGTRVPRLEEFLDLVQGSSKRILLELKGSWTTEQLRPVAAAVAERGLHERVLFASFDVVSLSNLREVAPALGRAVIARALSGDPAVLAGTCGALAIITNRTVIESDPSLVARIHAAGLGALLYTVNDPDGWTEAVSLGVDAIITDTPGALDDWLGGPGAALALAG